MAIHHQNPQIVGNTVYVDGIAVATITEPEGTSLHDKTISILSGEDAYQAGYNDGEASVDVDTECDAAHEEGYEHGFMIGKNEGYGEGYDDALKDYGLEEFKK